jgi:hypothetical protein
MPIWATARRSLVHRARHGQAGDVALHVGHQHRHAQAREAFGQHQQRHRLAGAGGAGDQAVAVAVLASRCISCPSCPNPSSLTATGLVIGACMLVVVAILPEALAQSRQQRSVDALEQRMEAAEQRYRAALVRIGNSDPAGSAEADAAIEDMEDVIVACGNLRGCHPANMLAAWKRLLKTRRGRRSPGSGRGRG